MQISFVMLIFLLFSNQFVLGRGQIRGGKLLEGKACSQLNNVSKHRNWRCFQRKPKQILVLYVIL